MCLRVVDGRFGFSFKKKKTFNPVPTFSNVNTVIRGAGSIFFRGGGKKFNFGCLPLETLEGRKFNRKLAGYLGACHDVTNR